MYTAYDKSMVIIPKITGLMSMFGSIALIRDLIKGPRAKQFNFSKNYNYFMKVLNNYFISFDILYMSLSEAAFYYLKVLNKSVNYNAHSFALCESIHLDEIN